MRLTRKKAIELCISLWTWLAETGAKFKSEWPEWEKYERNICWSHCWYCEYSNRRCKNTVGVNCKKCPLGGKSFECNDLYYGKWKEAETPRTRKKYAKLFLEQIESLK